MKPGRAKPTGDAGAAWRWRARGVGWRAAKAMSFLCGSPGRGRDVCPSETCGTGTDARCKRRDRAWEGEANVNERTNRTTRAGVEARRCFCGWAAPVCSTRPAKNSDAPGAAAPPPVERAAARTKLMHAARDAAEVIARSGRRRATHRHATRSCVKGGLGTKQKKGMSNYRDSDYGTSISDSR